MMLILICFLLSIPAPKDFETYLKQGDDYHKRFDNINAVNYYEKAYLLAPDNYEVLSKLTLTLNDAGEELIELRKRSEAEKYIERAVKYAEIFRDKFPDSAVVYCYLALSYGNIALFRGNKEKIKLAGVVEENARRSLAMDSSLFISYIVLGIYNREVANLNFFERLFANTFLGDVPDGSFDESVKMFNTALKILPQTIVPTYQLAKTYRYMGEKEKETELLRKIFTYKIQNFRDKFAIRKAKRRLENI